MPAPRQSTGELYAGAIIALADETATAAATWESIPTGEFRPALFPLTLHMSANVIGIHTAMRRTHGAGG